MPTSPIRVEDDDADGERHAGYAEECDLRPRLLTLRPHRETVSRRDGFGCIENLESGGQHRKNDQTTAEVDATKEELRNADSCLHFLQIRSARVCVACGGDNLTRSAAFCLSVFNSSSSSVFSSWNVGLRGSRNRPGVPGGLRALFIGERGVRGTSMLVCFMSPCDK